MPVPRPVTSPGSAPVKTEISAADAVVLAMPISPVSRALLPAATRSRAVSMPTSMAALTSSRVSAGPVVMSAVPGRTLRGRRPGVAGRSEATPTSMMQTSAPTWLANALQTAPPPRKLATIWAVTSCGQGVTPWACTPWSPAKIATAAGSGIGGGHCRDSPESWAEMISSMPSAPDGLVIRFCRSQASPSALASSGRMAVTVSASRSCGSPPGSARRPYVSSWTTQDSGRRLDQPACISSGSSGNSSTYPTHRYATTSRCSGRPSARTISRSSKKLTQPTPRPSARAASQRFSTASAEE